MCNKHKQNEKITERGQKKSPLKKQAGGKRKGAGRPKGENKSYWDKRQFCQTDVMRWAIINR